MEFVDEESQVTCDINECFAEILIIVASNKVISAT